MKLGTKIAGGFILLLLIAMALGGLAIYSMSDVQTKSTVLAQEYVPEMELATHLVQTSYRTMYNMRGYTYTEDTKYLTLGQEALQAVDTTIQEEGRGLQDRATALVKLGPALDEAEEGVTAYHGLVEEVVALNTKLDESRGQLDINAAQYMENCSEFLAGQNEKMRREITEGAEPAALEERLRKITLVNDIIDIGNATRVAAFKSQATRDPETMLAGIENFERREQLFEDLKAITREAEDHERIRNTRAAADGYELAMRTFLENWRERETKAHEMTATGQDVLDKAEALAQAGADGAEVQSEEAIDSLSLASTVMIVGLGIALVVGCVLAWVITVSITKPVNAAIAGLTEGASQVASASGQISSASQSLAEGSTEQAASLEESSSALEEMASMTRQNADNAGQANTMMGETKKQVDGGATAVKNMAGAMGEISQASEEIGKIIKTIEEIAFQTNLLALNAAVEAARAGEAGKGFAVVADEVRNLAQRAGQAARDTADLIESTVARVKNGTEIVGQLEASFTEIEGSATKVAGIISEISAASQEQAQGVDQVNTAVAQMDKVTQQNAANAEQSASASEELNAQADQLQSVVEGLASLVGGARTENGHGPSRLQPPKHAQTTTRRLGSGAGGQQTKKQQKSGGGRQPSGQGGSGGEDRELATAGARVVKPNDVIPLDEDDDDFKEF
jgi:methyl-accepting chemotaxis protein